MFGHISRRLLSGFEIVPFLPSSPMASYFQNAQKVVFQGTLINAAGSYVQGGRTTDPLQLLLNNITIGAMHNSEERSDAPRCHPDTRIAVQEEIVGWITDGDKDDCYKKVLWMTGPAGTGKTAIAGSVAELCKEKGLLAATFFFSSFSGSADRRSKRRLIATIAYQLLQCDALDEVGRRILTAIDRNPAIFGMRLKDQVDELILAPFQSVRGCAVDTVPSPKAIIIDGLDEVEPDHADGGASGTQRARDNIHYEILSALLHAAHDPGFPFRIVIVSRPERVIREFFAADPAHRITREIFLDNKYDPDTDITLFLRSKFADVRRRFNLPPPWPREEDIEFLVNNASGQFIYAATVVRYVSDPHSLPNTQLDRVLRLGPPASDEANPFAALDALYTKILETTPNPRLVVKWLRVTIFGTTIDCFPALFWRQFFESTTGEAVSLFSNLASLISMPPPQDSTSPYRFYHKSFPEFIARIPQSHPIYVDLHGKDGVFQFVLDRWISALKNKGPATAVSDTERAAFVVKLLSSGSVWHMLRRLRLVTRFRPCDATWPCQPEAKDALLSLDADWWMDQIFLRADDHDHIIGWYFDPMKNQPNAWSSMADNISGLFWDVHFGVSNAPVSSRFFVLNLYPVFMVSLPTNMQDLEESYYQGMSSPRLDFAGKVEATAKSVFTVDASRGL
ncbi:hypothetical protein NMY22_g19305 [Coprinellus aureogranulatus]|nr:hypothetical protein NMY22_g19305 [Coprinellus aureogranulatus]